MNLLGLQGKFGKLLLGALGNDTQVFEGESCTLDIPGKMRVHESFRMPDIVGMFTHLGTGQAICISKALSLQKKG